MLPELHLTLLGGFTVTLDNQPVTGLTSHKAQALLCYLAVTGRAFSRPALAGLLWPDVPEANARMNLRKELARLNQAFAPYLLINRESVALDSTANWRLDVQEFEALLNAPPHQPPSIAQLTAAVALYQGDFLEGFYVLNGPTLEEWTLRQRGRLRERVLQALQTIANAYTQQADHNRAITTLQQLLRLEPWREAAHYQLMRLYGQSSQRAAALAQFESCRQVLADELAVEPDIATMALVAAIRAGEFGKVYSDKVTEPVEVTPSPAMQFTTKADYPLVGRAAEWATLHTCWQTLACPHFVCIGGEAGIGKTRLAEELLLLAEREGTPVARSRSHALQGQLAYGPITDWLRTPPLQAALAHLEDVWLTEIARLLPELRIDHPHLLPVEPLREGWRRKRFFDALRHAFTIVDGRLLLVLDDLQWSDADTLEWLQYLLESSDANLLVVGTVRSDEIDGDHPLHHLRQQLQRRARLTELALAPLSPMATLDLAIQVAEEKIVSEVADQLFQDTAGNPLFIIERMRVIPVLDTATLRAIESTSPSIIERATIPPMMYSVIQARLAQLSPTAQSLAQFGATIGRAFDVTLIAKAAGRDEEAVFLDLDELWHRRVIREVDATHFDFSHDCIREIAYAEISPIKRRLLHRMVANALQAVHVGNLDLVSSQLALHYELAGLLEQAINFYQRAAEWTRRVYGNREAKMLYTCAITVAQHVGPTLDEAQLLPLYVGRAVVCRALTQLDEAIADWQVMRRIARAVGNRQKEGESLCQLAYTLWLTFAQEHIPLIKQCAEEALAVVATSTAPEVEGLALTMLGAVDQVQRRLPDAGRKLEEALQISRQAGNQEAVVETLAFLCLQHYLLGDFQSTVHVGCESVAVARTIHNDFNELRSQAFVCQAEWSLGNYAQAFTLVQQTMRQAEAWGNQFIQGRLLNTLGWFHHELGDFTSAITYNQQSVALGRASGVNHVELSALVNLAYDYLAAGEQARARDLFESTLSRVEHEGVGSHKWQWRMKLLIGLAEHAFITGAYSQALRYVEAGLDEALATHAQKYVVKGQTLRGRILTQAGKCAAAGEELRHAFALATALHSPSLLYPVAAALGQWYAEMGDAQQATRYYHQAKATINQMVSAISDETLAATFLCTEPVRLILEKAS